MDASFYDTHLQVLSEELIPAMGCTEPVAIAYAAALAHKALGQMPERISVQVSGNLVKNAKSVVVPNTGGLRGIDAAAIAGVVAGDAEKALEVISEVSQEQKDQISELLKRAICQVSLLDSCYPLDLIVTLYAHTSTAKVRIAGRHNNVILIEKDGQCLRKESPPYDTESNGINTKSLLTMEEILNFADRVEIEAVRYMLLRQARYNTAICEEGLKHSYGEEIGKIILQEEGDSVQSRCKALVAAGSDARMGGCELPVVINSGSGNQGITVSVPIVEYARAYGINEETMLRAMVVSNLTAIHIKSGIGPLSAYCGAASAAAGTAAGIGYLIGESKEVIFSAVINTLAVLSGMICDGAKASCAGKIATALDTAFRALAMARHGRCFHGGDGIVMDGVEDTICAVGMLGRDGMKQTDREILRIMTRGIANDM